MRGVEERSWKGSGSLNASCSGDFDPPAGPGFSRRLQGVWRNEALALRFHHIEWFSNDTQFRNAAVQMARKNENDVGPPKSRKSLRRIPATESVIKLLADLKVGKTGRRVIFPGDCSDSSTLMATPASRSPSIHTGISSQATARKPAPATRGRWPMRRFATKPRPVLAVRWQLMGRRAGGDRDQLKKLVAGAGFEPPVPFEILIS